MFSSGDNYLDRHRLSAIATVLEAVFTHRFCASHNNGNRHLENITQFLEASVL